jgi:hypothetical protein
VELVPREQPLPLARAIVAFLDAKRRTSRRTDATLDREFRPAAIAAKYREIYGSVCEGARR